MFFSVMVAKSTLHYFFTVANAVIQQLFAILKIQLQFSWQGDLFQS